MLSEPTLEKLRGLKLTGMVEALEEQRQSPKAHEMEFEERLGLLVERQWLWRENRALATRLSYAGLKQSACVENLDYAPSRGLKRGLIEQLLGSDWVGQGQSCLITGPTGTGKTYLCCALGHRACRDGYRVLYTYAPRLFRELKAAHLDGSLSKYLRKLSRIDLLLIDDLGLTDSDIRAYRDLLEILDERAPNRATLVSSQLPVSEWHGLIGDETIADALLDRLVHGAFRIELKGETLRKPRPKKAAK